MAMSQLFTRGDMLPPLHFSLGGDWYLTPFSNSVSLRKYASFGSEKVYPTRLGRLFTLDQWRFVLKVVPRVVAVVDKHASDYAFTTPYAFHVAVRTLGKRRKIRKVVFVQPDREEIALTKSQFLKLAEHGKAFLEQPLPLSKPVGGEKLSPLHQRVITVALDENCKPVEGEEEGEEERQCEGKRVAEPRPSSHKKPRGKEGGWTAPLLKRRGPPTQKSSDKKKRKTMPPKTKPVAPVPPKLLLTTEEEMPPLTPPPLASTSSAADHKTVAPPPDITVIDVDQHIEWMSDLPQSQDSYEEYFGTGPVKEDSEEEEDEGEEDEGEEEDGEETQ